MDAIEYQYFKSLKICPVCRKETPAGGHVTCDKCLARIREYNRVHSARHVANSVARIKRLCKAGLCRNCGKPAGGAAYCPDCAWFRNVKRRIIRRRRKLGIDDGEFLSRARLLKVAEAILEKWMSEYA